MSKALFTLALLAPAFTLPLTAHADTIDDFKLTGGGQTITFSLPATGVYTLHEHFNSFGANGPGTIDGTPVTIGATFYVLNVNPGDPALGLFSIPLLPLPDELWGSISYNWFIVPAEFPNPSDEGTFNVTFIPGTYQLQNSSPYHLPPPVLFDYTLTITPETTASTPEPASLTLLATGALGIISIAARRRRARPVLN
jgi:hypothetical protein